ncbi:collagen alpha-1(I) chain [Eschrichtius robustus]|uniref:collagen alpha-1(I) chain n=1 Tax=Eschrichtius robustus TaxID=9764 RepID=UPI0035C192C9
MRVSETTGGAPGVKALTLLNTGPGTIPRLRCGDRGRSGNGGALDTRRGLDAATSSPVLTLPLPKDPGAQALAALPSSHDGPDPGGITPFLPEVPSSTTLLHEPPAQPGAPGASPPGTHLAFLRRWEEATRAGDWTPRTGLTLVPTASSPPPTPPRRPPSQVQAIPEGQLSPAHCPSPGPGKVASGRSPPTVLKGPRAAAVLGQNRCSATGDSALTCVHVPSATAGLPSRSRVPWPVSELLVFSVNAGGPHACCGSRGSAQLRGPCRPARRGERPCSAGGCWARYPSASTRLHTSSQSASPGPGAGRAGPTAGSRGLRGGGSTLITAQKDPRRCPHAPTGRRCCPGPGLRPPLPPALTRPAPPPTDAPPLNHLTAPLSEAAPQHSVVCAPDLEPGPSFCSRPWPGPRLCTGHVLWTPSQIPAPKPETKVPGSSSHEEPGRHGVGEGSLRVNPESVFGTNEGRGLEDSFTRAPGASQVCAQAGAEHVLSGTRTVRPCRVHSGGPGSPPGRRSTLPTLGQDGGGLQRDRVPRLHSPHLCVVGHVRSASPPGVIGPVLSAAAVSSVMQPSATLSPAPGEPWLKQDCSLPAIAHSPPPLLLEAGVQTWHVRGKKCRAPQRAEELRPPGAGASPPPSQLCLRPDLALGTEGASSARLACQSLLSTPAEVEPGGPPSGESSGCEPPSLPPGPDQPLPCPLLVHLGRVPGVWLKLLEDSGHLPCSPSLRHPQSVRRQFWRQSPSPPPGAWVARAAPTLSISPAGWQLPESGGALSGACCRPHTQDRGRQSPKEGTSLGRLPGGSNVRANLEATDPTLPQGPALRAHQRAPLSGILLEHPHRAQGSVDTFLPGHDHLRGVGTVIFASERGQSPRPGKVLCPTGVSTDPVAWGGQTGCRHHGRRLSQPRLRATRSSSSGPRTPHGKGPTEKKDTEGQTPDGPANNGESPAQGRAPTEHSPHDPLGPRVGFPTLPGSSPQTWRPGTEAGAPPTQHLPSTGTVTGTTFTLSLLDGPGPIQSRCQRCGGRRPVGNAAPSECRATQRAPQEHGGLSA